MKSDLSLSLRINVLRPFIHRRNRMNCAGLGRRQRFEKLQEGLIVLGLNGDVVGMFLGGDVPLGPELIEHRGSLVTSSRAILRRVRPMSYKQHPIAVIHNSPSSLIICLSILS